MSTIVIQTTVYSLLLNCLCPGYSKFKIKCYQFGDISIRRHCLNFSQDLAMMCRQLNMEDAVEEIMVQLGADDSGRISFDEFLQCRMRLITEIEQERLKERGLVSMHPGLSHWPIGKFTEIATIEE